MFLGKMNRDGPLSIATQFANLSNLKQNDAECIPIFLSQIKFFITNKTGGINMLRGTMNRDGPDNRVNQFKILRDINKRYGLQPFALHVK
jgi:hypothetical protein